MPEPQLDEIQWRLPPQRIQEQFRGMGIVSNTILWYFAESPFFDRMSNNQALITQSFFNPAMAAVVQTREAWEAQLRTMQGLEFMTAGEPRPVGEAGQSSAVWVIRKQNRRKRPGQEDEVTVLGTYFVIGENVYQAPAVKDILSSKVVGFTLLFYPTGR
jgi:mediator of RNA polymerase II transcription subunit 6